VIDGTQGIARHLFPSETQKRQTVLKTAAARAFVLVVRTVRIRRVLSPALGGMPSRPDVAFLRRYQ